MKALVKKGAVVNQPGAAQGITPLHWAAHKEHAGICQFLIEHSADILCKDREGRTPLSMASPDLAARMIGVFVCSELTCNSLTQHPVCLCVYVCVFGMCVCVWYVCAVYADVAKCKNPDVVFAAQRKLVSGGQPFIVHNQLLCSYCMRLCVQCLCPYDASPGSEKAVTACCGGNVPALKALIQAGVSVNHVTGNSSATLLHMAAYCGQVGDWLGPKSPRITCQI